MAIIHQYNPKAFYEYVATKTDNNETIPNLLKTDSSLTENYLGKAEVLNNYFRHENFGNHNFDFGGLVTVQSSRSTSARTYRVAAFS